MILISFLFADGIAILWPSICKITKFMQNHITQDSPTKQEVVSRKTGCKIDVRLDLDLQGVEFARKPLLSVFVRVVC